MHPALLAGTANLQTHQSSWSWYTVVSTHNALLFLPCSPKEAFLLQGPDQIKFISSGKAVTQLIIVSSFR